LENRGENAVTGPTSRAKRAPEELDKERAEELPERQAMSLIAANVAASDGAAAALTVLSDDSTAVTDAEQAPDEHQEARWQRSAIPN
jgi:hypothetical protein